MEDQVGDNRQVYNQESHFDPRDPVAEFDDLERQEGSSDDGGQIFGPGFFEQEADALEDTEAGVDEDEEAEPAEEVIVDQVRFLKEKANEAAFGIAVQGVNEIHKNVGDVFVDQLEGSKAGGDEQGGLQ